MDAENTGTLGNGKAIQLKEVCLLNLHVAGSHWLACKEFHMSKKETSIVINHSKC